MSEISNDEFPNKSEVQNQNAMFVIGNSFVIRYSSFVIGHRSAADDASCGLSRPTRLQYLHSHNQLSRPDDFLESAISNAGGRSVHCSAIRAPTQLGFENVDPDNNQYHGIVRPDY